MCIRDSLVVGQGAPVEFGADQEADEVVAGGRSCLLYTSDAADERSSVDLGGRRIIKKQRGIDQTRRSWPTRRTSITTA